MRQKFSEAVTAGRRIEGEQITTDYYNELVKAWGGPPALETLSSESNNTCAIDNVYADNFFDVPNNRSSNSLSNSTPYKCLHFSASTLTKWKSSTDRNKEYLDTDGVGWGVLLMKLNHPKMYHYQHQEVHKLIPKKKFQFFCWLQPFLFRFVFAVLQV